MKFERDLVAIVETNVDDTTGEILGRTLERLLEEGAYDATVSPYLGKKGRMGETVRVTCSTDSSEKFAQLLVEETGTLGVKITEVTRLIVPRTERTIPISIDGGNWNVRVKIADIHGRMRVKPETEDLKQIAKVKKIPIREVMDLVSVAARQYLSEKPAAPDK